MQLYLNNNKNVSFFSSFFPQKSNRLSKKQDHCSSQKSLVLKKKKTNMGRKGETVKIQNKNTNVPLSLEIPRLELQDQPALKCGVAQHRTAKMRPCGFSRLWRHWGCRLWWNVRLPAGQGGDAGDSRLEVPVGVPGGMGVVRSMAGSLLWLRRGLGTTADAATAGLSVRSSLKEKSRHLLVIQVNVEVNLFEWL